MDDNKLESLHEYNMKAALVYEQKAQEDKEKYEVVLEENEIIITSNDYTKNSITTEELRKRYAN